MLTDLTLSSNASPTLHRNKAFPNPAHGGSTPFAAQQSTIKTLNNNKQQQNNQQCLIRPWGQEYSRNKHWDFQPFIVVEDNWQTSWNNQQQFTTTTKISIPSRRPSTIKTTIIDSICWFSELKCFPKSRNCRKISLRPFQHAQGTNGRILNLFQCSNWNSLLEFE